MTTRTTPEMPVIGVGPSGRRRINPHAIRHVMLRGPTGRPRIDRTAPGRGLLGRSGGDAVAVATAHPATAELPLRTIDDPTDYVLAIPDLPDGRLTPHDRDMLGAARRLADPAGGAVVALVFGEPHDDLGLAGVDRVLRCDAAACRGYAPEARTAAALAAVHRLDAGRVVLCDSPLGGGDLGRRLAARLGERAAANVWKMDAEAVTSRSGDGGTDIGRPAPRVVLVAPEVAEPVNGVRHEARALDPLELEDGDGPGRLEDLGPVPVDPDAVPLAEAEFIIAAGNGVRDWDAFHACCGALGATEAASRVAVDDGHMPRDRQVGATGTLVTARVYLALGISGAPQHLQGIAKCDTVIAVNTDPSCDMVKRADVAVIADVQAVMPALARLYAEQAEDADTAEEEAVP